MMQSQLTLAEYSKRQAIATVEAGSPTFCALAYETLLLVASRGVEFSSLDVWAAYRNSGGTEPNHPRAMGAVFARAAREGVIERTGRRIKSGRESDHDQEICTWRLCAS